MPSGTPTLRFHARTFERVGVTPKAVSTVMEALFAEREHACGVSFPPSVREWYLFDGPALDLKIGCGPTADTMIPLRGLGLPFADWYFEPEARPKDIDDDDTIPNDLLEVMFENQGVCRWAVKLDGSDDPPVMYEIDSREPGVWKLCAESFSTFMYTRVLDFGHCLKNMAVSVRGFDPPLAPGDLKFLQSRFAEGPRTYGFPGHTNYRFFAPDLDARDSAILLYNDEVEAEWHLVASSDEALLRLIGEVWHCGTLRESLQARRDDARSQQVLARARSGA